MRAVAVFGALLLASIASADTTIDEADLAAALAELGGVEGFEAIEEIEVVAPDPPTSLELTGRLHAAVVHLPVAFVFLACLTELLAFVTRRPEYRFAVRYVLVVTCLAAIPALVTGSLRVLEVMPRDPVAGAAAIAHGNAAGAALAAAAAALWLEERRRLWLARVCLVIAFVLVAYGGHLGGELVYGEGFFPF